MALVLSVALSGACGDETCPEGSRAEGERCVPAPADGGDADGGDGGPEDGGPDAGPCGGECPSGSVCDEGSGECVQCLGASECTEAGASRCEAGICAPCMTNGDCAHIAGMGVCDEGECVECTTGEATACGTSPCTTSNTCSAYGTAQDTCEPCDTDDNCMGADDYCVPLDYMGAMRGGYCLTDADDPGCMQPYSITLDGRTTLSGRTGGRYCGVNEALTTCEAVRALLDNQTCPGGTDAECPEGGLCREVGTLVGTRCTYRCSLAVQCTEDGSPGGTCGPGTTGAEDYCGG